MLVNLVMLELIDDWIPHYMLEPVVKLGDCSLFLVDVGKYSELERTNDWIYHYRLEHVVKLGGCSLLLVGVDKLGVVPFFLL